jgi:hypothetical protein
LPSLLAFIAIVWANRIVAGGLLPALPSTPVTSYLLPHFFASSVVFIRKNILGRPDKKL